MSKQVFDQMVTLATSAFGLVAALAWNEAIQTLFKEIFGKAGGIISLFVYAVAVTVVAVIVTSRLGKIKEKLAKKEPEKTI